MAMARIETRGRGKNGRKKTEGKEREKWRVPRALKIRLRESEAGAPPG